MCNISRCQGESDVTSRHSEAKKNAGFECEAVCLLSNHFTGQIDWLRLEKMFFINRVVRQSPVTPWGCLCQKGVFCSIHKQEKSYEDSIVSGQEEENDHDRSPEDRIWRFKNYLLEFTAKISTIRPDYLTWLRFKALAHLSGIVRTFQQNLSRLLHFPSVPSHPNNNQQKG